MALDSFITNWIQPLFLAWDNSSLVRHMVLFKLMYTIATFFWMMVMPAPYGRYADAKFGAVVNAKVAWCVQEIPALLVPVVLMVMNNDGFLGMSITNQILIGMFMLHYFQRSLIFPFLIRGGKPTPLSPFLAAVVFCLFNGFMQGFYLILYKQYDRSWLHDPRFLLGMAMFFSGMTINLHSDHVLRNLRKPGEVGYKIPTGGLFNFISGANYFGEILEWAGFAIASWSPTAFVFAFFTAVFLGQRSYHHHRYYLQKFEDYPKNRKVVLPYLW